MDTIIITISSISLFVSILAIVYTVRSNKRNIEITNRTNNHLSIINVEKSLAEIPSALRFHGINIEEVKKHISIEEFVYLLNSFTSGRLFYLSEDLTKKNNFNKGSYRWYIIKHPDFIKIWPYLKNMIYDKDYKRIIENTLNEQ